MTIFQEGDLVEAITSGKTGTVVMQDRTMVLVRLDTPPPRTSEQSARQYSRESAYHESVLRKIHA